MGPLIFINNYICLLNNRPGRCNFLPFVYYHTIDSLVSADTTGHEKLYLGEHILSVGNVRTYVRLDARWPSSASFPGSD